MEKETIAINDVLKNPHHKPSPFIGRVININGDRITLEDLGGSQTTFIASYLTPATPAESQKFTSLFAITPKRRNTTNTFSNDTFHVSDTVRQDINRLFPIGNTVKSGGGKTDFIILEISSAGVMVKGISAKKPECLEYSKIKTIIDYLPEIEKALSKDGTIQKVIQRFLGKRGLKEIITEGYLLGFAREHKKRATKP